MMGGHHAAMGAAAWVGITGVVPYSLAQFPVSPLGVATGAVVCAGAALLPDLDHHNGTMAHSLPPLSMWIARAVGKLSGGHRNGTHSLGFLALSVAASTLVGLFKIDGVLGGSAAIGPGICSVLLAACALKALKLGNSRLLTWLCAFGFAAAITVWAPHEWGWFPVAVGIGVACHILGDLVTTEGVPLFWPIAPKPPKFWKRSGLLSAIWRPSGNLAIPILGDAGSWREWLVMIPVSAYAIYGVVAALVMA